MVLVPSDDGSRSRVGPKVFADVPSATELNAQKAQLTSVKRSRAWFVILAVLFLGGLIALGLFAASQSQQIENADTEHQAALDELQAQLDNAAERLDQYENLPGMREIRAELASIRDQRAYIQGKVDGSGDPPRVPADLVNNTTFADPRWPALQQQVLTELRQELEGRPAGRREIEGLNDTAERVRRWRPAPVVNPRPEPERSVRSEPER